MVFGNMGEIAPPASLHARSLHRREHVLRRIPGQRAGRGRGRRHPHAAAAVRARAKRARSRWKRRCRDAYAELCAVRETLERHYRDMQDIEFTVAAATSSTCCRPATASAPPRPRCGSPSIWPGGPDHQGRGGQARRTRGARPVAAPDARPQGAKRTLLAKGLPASARAPPPARSCSPPTTPRACAPAKGETVILVRVETSPEDIHGMHAAQRHPDRARRHDQPRRRGGARHGPALRLRRRRHSRRLRRQTLSRRRPHVRRRATSSPSTAPPARCSSGAVPTVRAAAVRRFRHADGLGRRGAPAEVRANAETPLDAETARKFGAEGIGLCRTEHMFFDARAHRRRARDDHGRRRARPPRGAGKTAAVCSARISSSCSASWTACR